MKLVASLVRLMGDSRGEIVCLIKFSVLNEALLTCESILNPKTSTERRFFGTLGDMVMVFLQNLNNFSTIPH